VISQRGRNPRIASLTALLLWAAMASASAQLRYQECSNGLTSPSLHEGDTEFEMVDVDLDGHVDIVSVGDHGNPLVNTTQEGVMVWFGDGAGVWSQEQYGYLGYGGVAVGDVNWDGRVDVAYGIHHNYSSNDLGDAIFEVALGDGSGRKWTPWDDGIGVHGEYWGMFATDLGDVDGDGDLDVGSTGFGASGGMQIYLNQGDGTWLRSFGFLEGNSDHVFVFGDVDGDGHRDIATAKEEGTVWLNDGEGFFTAVDGNLPALPPFRERMGPSLGDVDGDGRDDIAFCADDGSAEVWLWRGDAEWLDVSATLPAITTCEFTQLRDMNGDGLIDLSTFGSGRVDVVLGDGSGDLWTSAASFSTGDIPGAGKAFRVGGDIDHNGRADMVLVGSRYVGTQQLNFAHCYRELSIPSETFVRIVEPGPHRRWLAGAVAFIEWEAGLAETGPGTADIEVSLDGTAGPWRPVASGLPNNGRYQWRVPSGTSDDARLRITVTTASTSATTTSAERFVIARRPDPLVLAFVDAETIEWTDSLTRGNYNLYRGDWRHFLETGEYTQDPSFVPAAATFCDEVGTTRTDAFVPAPGDLAYYLVTGYRMMEDGQEPGVAVPMTESTLGQDASATTRPNHNRCPS